MPGPTTRTFPSRRDWCRGDMRHARGGGLRVCPGGRRLRGRGGAADPGASSAARRLAVPAQGRRRRVGSPTRPVALVNRRTRTTIFVALGATIRDKDLPPRAVRGSAQRVPAGRHGRRATRSWADVMDYCRRSANPVGRLVLRIAGYRDAQLDGWSDAICTRAPAHQFLAGPEDRFRSRAHLPSRRGDARARRVGR